MEYELSISRNYVSDWDVNNAIRELLQNCIDSKKNGNKLTINYRPDIKKLFITNDGCTLDISTLVVLLREGYCVNIYTGTELLKPYFGYSTTFKSDVLKIKSEPYKTDCVIFAIDNIDKTLFEELKEYFPCIENDFGEVIENEYGQILKDKRFKGKMFVEGLYIQDDKNFKYGYNFNNKYVKLDRDRKTINYYTLRKLTAKSMITAETCDTEIFGAICNSVIDAKYIKDVIKESSEDFIESFADMYRENKKIDKDTIVATEGVAKVLKRNGYKVIVGSELESLLIAKQLDKETLLKEAKEELQNKNQEQEIWSDLLYSDYLKLIQWYYKNKHLLTNEAITEFNELCLNEDCDLSLPYHFENVSNYFFDNLPASCNDTFIQEEINSFEEDKDEYE